MDLDYRFLTAMAALTFAVLLGLLGIMLEQHGRRRIGLALLIVAAGALVGTATATALLAP